MFDFGISETITLVIVILVLINPKELPAIVRKIGQIYGQIMKQINAVKRTYSDFEKEVDTVAKEIEIKGSDSSVRSGMKSDLIKNGTKRRIKGVVR